MFVYFVKLIGVISDAHSYDCENVLLKAFTYRGRRLQQRVSFFVSALVKLILCLVYMGMITQVPSKKSAG